MEDRASSTLSTEIPYSIDYPRTYSVFYKKNSPLTLFSLKKKSLQNLKCRLLIAYKSAYIHFSLYSCRG